MSEREGVIERKIKKNTEQPRLGQLLIIRKTGYIAEKRSAYELKDLNSLKVLGTIPPTSRTQSLVREGESVRGPENRPKNFFSLIGLIFISII